MDIYVLDQSFNTIAIIDTYESLIWTDRYYEYGDFELYLPMNIRLFDYLQAGNYLYYRGSEHMMVIENFEINTDVENGSHLTVTGRSLESILERRIIWGQKTYSGTIQTVIKNMITDAIISPDIADRKIENFIFQNSSDPSMESVKLETQFTGDNLYDTVSKLCQMVGIGFKIILNNSNQFVFSLYEGADRSYSQNNVPYVIFSPEFENIINSRYTENNSYQKNVTLVAGEGEGSARKTRTVGSGSGLARRELFTDARDLSTQTNDGVLTEEQYNKQLDERGAEKLKDYTVSTAFDGKAETTRMFVYGEDFFMGDIIQIANEFGMESRAYISEIIFNQDEKGFGIYPKFEMIN